MGNLWLQVNDYMILVLVPVLGWARNPVILTEFKVLE